MKTVIKAMLVLAVVAVTGCQSVIDANAHAQALYNASPAKYDSMSTSDKGNEYFKANPQFQVQGS